MSRERELLQRVLDGDANRHWTISSRLYKKIEEVLDQPEQGLTPLTPKLISLGNNCHESFIKGIRFAEKMHGIGGGE